MTKNDQQAVDRRDVKSKDKKDSELTHELDNTFPASDPPASTQPGSGVTGAEVTPARGPKPGR